MKNSQKKRIISKLKRDGFVTRNECLKNYISRLGAIICLLKSEGFEFRAEDMKNGDYRYTWINKPPEKEILIYEKNGIMVAREQIKNKLL